MRLSQNASATLEVILFFNSFNGKDCQGLFSIIRNTSKRLEF